jgi:hypothetical protein
MPNCEKCPSKKYEYKGQCLDCKENCLECTNASDC